MLAAVSCTRSVQPQPEGPAATSGGRTAAQGGQGGAGGKPPAAHGGSGAGGAGGTGGGYVEVDGGVCCPPDESPGCCMNYGGFAPTGRGCFHACDGMPSPNEAWRLIKDEQGCDVWVEPDTWSSCCGCGSPDEAFRRCDAVGRWKIRFESTPCGPPAEETITITADEDAGTPEITFAEIDPARDECRPTPSLGSYETSVSISPTGCIVRAAVRAEGCRSGETQCEDLEIELQIAGETATVKGTYTRCWCGTNSGPQGSPVKVRGTAEKL